MPRNAGNPACDYIHFILYRNKLWRTEFDFLHGSGTEGHSASPNSLRIRTGRNKDPQIPPVCGTSLVVVVDLD